jgi:hypothetical protein
VLARDHLHLTPASINALVCLAIFSSSSVGITHIATHPDASLIRAAPLAFAAASTVTPSQAAWRHTRSRITAACIANAGCENQRVEALRRSGERPKLAPDPKSV